LNVKGRDELYDRAAAEFGAALGRLACAYENDAEKRRDLLQDIHLALWRSFEGFDGRCSLRTWVYRVAHNAAATYAIREKRLRSQVLVSLEELAAMPAPAAVPDGLALTRLTEMIQRLRPLDRQVIVSWLEGMEAAAIAELTGISPGNVATKVHRIKDLLARQFQKGGQYGG